MSVATTGFPIPLDSSHVWGMRRNPLIAEITRGLAKAT